MVVSKTPETQAAQLSRVAATVADYFITRTLMDYDPQEGEKVLQAFLQKHEAGKVKDQVTQLVAEVTGEEDGDPDNRLTFLLQAKDLQIPLALLVPEVMRKFPEQIIDFLAMTPAERKQYQKRQELMYGGLTPSRYTDDKTFGEEPKNS